ncbi:MAG TPA: hypothetical protein VGR69_11365 [Candidatus Rubrimentiphilum sp.]|nr:hypothetical protein [Candidatus Rubrimentiphilum sp.]
MRIRHYIPLAGAGLAALLSAAALAAPPGGVGGGRPGTMPAVPPVGRPIGRPATAPNPNGTPPVGRATNAPDTDRGRSEGKGRTDTTRTMGTVASFTGTTLTLKLPTGITKTFTVNAHARGQLKPGAAVVVTTRPNSSSVVSIVPANQSVTGTVVGTTKTTVTLKLPNGRTQTISVASQAAAHMNLTPGSVVTVMSNNGGMTATKIIVRPRPTPSP